MSKPRTRGPAPFLIFTPMLTPRMKRTLRYCLILLAVLTPVYFLVYTLFWNDVPKNIAFQTSLLYAVVNMVFLGALHYVYAGKKSGQEDV